MLILLIAHFAAALVAPVLVSRWGRRVFLLLALVPASAAIWALSQTSAVRAGNGPTSSWTWIAPLGLEVNFALDTLSWLMTLMVGGVGAGVLAYCSRYFSTRSSALGRFAAVLTAFAGAMLGLVLSTNLIQIYMFWELTSVFSFLLIGHYFDRVSSRRAANKAILVTTLGGLVMLVGILIIGNEAGSFEVSDVIAAGAGSTVSQVAIGLILVGALSKSAIMPFHIWLPSAMAAPTPVSAYLHAAAMVKAGIFLVARLAPGFATAGVWQWMLFFLGCATLITGGYKALRQYDLKLILAYGTVSQLGMLMVLLGAPYQSTALAGLALLAAHAMFKASLFLSVGVIDATTGTRDIRRLSGLGRMMPGTAAMVGLAVASMIGLPPFAGYLAKEAALEAFLHPGMSVAPSHWMVLAALSVGSAITVGYGLRLWWGAFATKPADKYPIVVSRPPLLLILPPAVLAVAGLALAWFPATLESLLSPHANTYPLGSPGHLTLWAGFGAALALTAIILAAGFGLFKAGDRIQRWTNPWPKEWDADLVYRHNLRRLDRIAKLVTAQSQRGSLPFYLGTIFVVVLVLVGGTAIFRTSWPDRVNIGGDLPEVAVGVLIVAAAVMAIRARRRLKAVILTGITGYGTATIFMLHGAPDLALTQVLVETVTVVVFILVLRRLPVYFSNRPLAAERRVRMAIGGAMGVLVGALAIIIPQARIHQPISATVIAEAVTFGGGYNIVNVILVDTRAWDTLGEISVLLAAATGIASLIFVKRRNSDAHLLPGDISESAGVVGAADPDPMAAIRAQAPQGQKERVEQIQWLSAGVTLAPQRRSVILEVATRILYHNMLVFAVFLLFSGHNRPGGGFVAGLITGVALIIRYLAGGRYELGAAAPLKPGFVLGTGLFLGALAAVTPVFFGGVVLQSAIIETTLPLLGDFKLVTSLFFDIGVFLVVVGLMLDVLKSLGAEVDRQGEVSGADSITSSRVLEPRNPLRERPS